MKVVLLRAPFALLRENYARQVSARELQFWDFRIFRAKNEKSIDQKCLEYISKFVTYQSEKSEVLKSHVRTTNLTISNYSIKRYHSEKN